MSRSLTPVQWSIIFLAIALSAGSILYRLLMHERLGHSSLMFLGIPAVLTILLALTPKAKSITGGIMKGITIALLIVAPLMGEGYLCILIASPLFYLLGAVVGVISENNRRKRFTKLSCISIILIPMAFEGVTPQLSFRRTQSVEVTETIHAPASAIALALSSSPRIDTPLPAFLRIGFPRPLQAYGSGSAIGSYRIIHFAGAEGDPPGDLMMRVAESQPGLIRFDTVSDNSKLTQWISWNSSEVRWTPLDKEHTSVSWRISFDRKLDPAWYFTPWERAAVRDAAEYLIESNATPTEAKQ
ncbi:hypothetical protein ACFPT7_14710 [Acidicapsa dinghuensis]|uniref:SRPBCC family protein n=1 Tax=Acidicapsa dinghuensis TaxID=2218256 RepID=A0ABW1EHB3_9BACT|nr:hypothetical protein [Acidicapsa dinghuensis]